MREFDHALRRLRFALEGKPDIGPKPSVDLDKLIQLLGLDDVMSKPNEDMTPEMREEVARKIKEMML